MEEEKKITLKKKIVKYSYLIGLVLVILVCYGWINYFCYHTFTYKVSPFKTFSGLYRLYRKTNNFILKSDIIDAVVFRMIVPLTIYFIIGLLLLLKKEKLAKSNEERKTIKGSAKWATLEQLQKSDYAFTWDSLLKKNQSGGHGKSALSVVVGQSNDAESDSTNPQRMQTKKWGKLLTGCNIEKFNTLTIGGIGSGKGAGTICPTLLSFPDSVIVYDPAKENYNVTAGYRQKLGYVQCFDPSDPNCSLHFNPLDWIRRNVSYVTGDIGNISQIIVPTQAGAKDAFWDNSARNMLNLFIAYVIMFYPKNEQTLKSVCSITQIADWSSDKFYYDNMKVRLNDVNREMETVSAKSNTYKKLYAEQQFLENELKSLDDEEKEKEDKIAQINKMEPAERVKASKQIANTRKEIQKTKMEEHLSEETGMNCLLNKIETDADYALKIFVMFDDKSNEWEKTLLNYIKRTVVNIKINAKSENTISSTFNVLDSNLSFFAEETVSNLMDKTTFTADDLIRGNKPMSLFLCIKNADTDRCKSFVKLFVSCIIAQLTDDYSKPYTHHLLFILDEFPQLGYMEKVEKAMPYVRKYHMSFMLIIQSLSQLQDKDAYGPDKTKTILNNTRLLDIKQVSDIETAKWVSERLSNKTVILDSESQSYQKGHQTSTSTGIKEEGRALMNPTEIIEMDPATELMIIANLPSAKVKKLQYFEHPEFTARAAIKFDDSLPISEKDEKEQKNKPKEIGEKIPVTSELKEQSESSDNDFDNQIAEEDDYSYIEDDTSGGVGNDMPKSVPENQNTSEQPSENKYDKIEDNVIIHQVADKDDNENSDNMMPLDDIVGD